MIVVLHNIRSVHNVGSIFRTADAVGVEKIYLCGITPSPLDRLGKLRQQFTKISLGAEKSVTWEKFALTSRVIEKLKRESYKIKIVAVEQDKAATTYYSLPTTYSFDKTALVLGNEVKGLPVSVLNRADKIIEIPMAGQKESLNVAVAFGIVAFGLKYG